MSKGEGPKLVLTKTVASEMSSMSWLSSLVPDLGHCVLLLCKTLSSQSGLSPPRSIKKYVHQGRQC